MNHIRSFAVLPVLLCGTFVLCAFADDNAKQRFHSGFITKVMSVDAPEPDDMAALFGLQFEIRASRTLSVGVAGFIPANLVDVHAADTDISHAGITLSYAPSPSMAVHPTLDLLLGACNETRRQPLSNPMSKTYLPSHTTEPTTLTLALDLTLNVDVKLQRKVHVQLGFGNLLTLGSVTDAKGWQGHPEGLFALKIGSF